MLLEKTTADQLDFEPNTDSKSTINTYFIKNKMFQTPILHLSHFGIPSESQYHKTDSERSFIKTPIDEHVELKTNLTRLDAYLSSDEFRKKLKLTKKYTYCPMLKGNADNDKPDYIKLKLKYYDNNVNCVLFQKEENGRQDIKFKSLDEFKKHVCYKSRFRALVSLKLWIQTSTLKNPMYGVSLTVQKVEVSEKPKHNLPLEFLSSDEED
jgi:hypothetical protein